MEDPSNPIEIPSKTTAAQEKAIPRSHRRFNKALRIIAVVLAVVFAVLIVFNILAKPFDKTRSAYTNVTVEEGDSVSAVADKLEEQKIVGSAAAFKTVSRLVLLTDFKPGTYYLSPSMDSVSIAREMCKGRTTLNGFVIPEGYTSEQIFNALARDGFGDKEAFVKAASDPSLRDIDFIGKDIKGVDQVAGFLLPDSYTINSDADETMIIMTMLDNFSNFFNEDYRARADELDASIREIIIIASIIEKETTVDSEKADISSVIHNRFNLGLTGPDETYDIPLCSPGKASIIAALYPSDSEDIYYVYSSKLDGTHEFTADEGEYKALKEAYENAVADKQERYIRREHAAGAEEPSESGAQTDPTEGSEDSSDAPEGEN